MFYVFKSVPNNVIDEEINKIFRDFDLLDKKDIKACNLSREKTQIIHIHSFSWGSSRFFR